MNKKRVDTGGGNSLSQNPFDSLGGTGDLPDFPSAAEKPTPLAGQEQPSKGGRKAGPKKRGRVEIRREKSGRGGKTVTTVTGFQGAACPAELEEWTSQLRKRCGTGGATKSGTIEIQGDRRDDLVRFFEEKGFRPVLAGG